MLIRYEVRVDGLPLTPCPHSNSGIMAGSGRCIKCAAHKSLNKKDEFECLCGEMDFSNYEKIYNTEF